MGRFRWSILGGAALGVVLVPSAGTAAAHVVNDNACRGSGTFRGSALTVDLGSVGDNVIVIPRKDTVDWQGAVTSPPGINSGSISVDLPPPFGEVEIESWSGDSQITATSGTREYDLPSVVPSGVELKVVVSHTDQNGSCSGYVRFEVAGGPYDSLLPPISFLGTAITGATLVAMIRTLFGR